MRVCNRGYRKSIGRRDDPDGRMLSALVLPWSSIVFGSLIGPAVGVGVLWLLRERHRPTLTASALGVCAGTWLWNTMLNIRHAGVIDGDIAFKPSDLMAGHGHRRVLLRVRRRDAPRNDAAQPTRTPDPQDRRHRRRRRARPGHLHLVTVPTETGGWLLMLAGVAWPQPLTESSRPHGGRALPTTPLAQHDPRATNLCAAPLASAT